MSEHPIPPFEDARSAALLLSLSPASPIGADVRGLPAFEEMEADVRLIETEGPGGVPWERVARIGLELLSSHGRDLLVGAWTTVALTHSEQWRGLALGLDALSAMVKEWWDILPPKRERARVGALEWMVARLTPVVSALAVGEDDIAAVAHASTLLEDLHTLLPQKLTREQIAFGDLVRAVRPKAEEAKGLLARAAAATEARSRQEAAQAAASAPQPSPVPAPPPQAAPAAPAPATSLPDAAPPPPPEVPAGAAGPELDRALGALADSMRRHARQLRETHLADPRSYRLTRAAAWLDISLPPPATGSATQLAAPSAERLEGIAVMGRVGEHEALVRTVEGMIGSAPFWLDANRLAFESLAALGGRHALAAEAVVEMTCAFMRRLPALAEMTFSNGMPFAGPATRAWLEQQAGSGAAGAPAEGQQADGLPELAEEIRGLVGAGKKAEALDRLGAARAEARGGRALFELHIIEVQACLDLDIPGVALPLAQHLEAELERRALDAWEPGLALRATRLALRAFRHPAAEKLLGGPALRAAAETAQRRLARLDLRTAVRLMHA